MNTLFRCLTSILLSIISCVGICQSSDEVGISQTSNKSIPMCFHLGWNSKSSNIFFNCKNIDQFSCPGKYNYTSEGICITPNNVTCIIKTSYSYASAADMNSTAYVECPDCEVILNTDLDWEDAANNQTCISYITDQPCPASVDYFHHSNLTWKACHNGTALGLFTNPKTNEDCNVLVGFNNTGVIHVFASCPNCLTEWGSPDGFIDSYDFGHGRHCFEEINDDSCSLPHFVCEELNWRLCVKGNGVGRCVNYFDGKPLSCDIHISPASLWPCANGTKGCGKIHCTDFEIPCLATWNMPGKAGLYEAPQGCMPIVNSDPAFKPSGKKKLYTSCLTIWRSGFRSGYFCCRHNNNLFLLQPI